eukprot:14288334-Heterocapsa_arctica.AAC.1
MSEDMGQRIKRPMASQGITRKEARTKEVIEGDCVMKGESLDEQWRHWNEASEAYLGKVENKPSQEYKGRGKRLVLSKMLSPRLKTTVRASPSLQK